MNRRLLVIVAGTLAALIAFALVLPTLDVLESPFSAYGDDDADISLLVNGLRAQGYDVASLTLGPPALSGVDAAREDAFYLAVGVDRGYSQPEIDALLSFVQEGGTAVVMDDTGASDALLAELGLQKGATLLSTTGDQPSVVRTQIAGTLVNLWEPVEIVPQEGADVTILASADNTTAKDTNGNDQVDPEEPTCAGGCAVAVRAELGEGSIYVLGDPTFATNKYYQTAGALPVMQNITETERTAGSRSLIIADESRHVAGPAEVGLTLFRLIMAPLGLPFVAYGAAGLVVAAAGFSSFQREEGTWAEHEPGFEDPYLPETADGGPQP